MEHLTYMFKDPDWRRKLAIGSLVSIIPVVNFATLGYVLDVVRAIRNDGATWLPDWSRESSDYFMEGLEATIATCLYLAPVLVIILAQSSNRSSATQLILQSGTNNIAVLGLNAWFIVLSLLLIAYLVGLMAWLPAMLAHYAAQPTLKSLLDYKSIFRLAVRGKTYTVANAVTLAILVPITVITCAVLFAIPCFGWIGALAVAAFLPMYASLILAYHTGIVARIAADKQPVVPPTPIAPPKPKVIQPPQPTPQPTPRPADPPRAAPASASTGASSGAPAASTGAATSGAATSALATAQPATPRAVVYTLTVPRDLKWQPENATRFVEHVLTQMSGTVALQIVADHTSVTWQLLDYLVEWENTEGIIKGIRTIYPEAEVTCRDYAPPSVDKPFSRVVLPFVLGSKIEPSAPWVVPALFVEDTKQNDPLTALVQAIAGDLKPGSRATFTVCATGFLDEATRKRGQNALKRTNVNWIAVALNLSLGGVSGWARTAAEVGGMAVSGNLKTDKYRPEDQKVAMTKPYLKALWNTYIVVQLDAEDESDLVNAHNALNVILNGYKTDYNWFEPVPIYQPDPVLRVTEPIYEQHNSTIGLLKQFNSDPQRWAGVRCVLSAHEIAALFHPPHEQFKTSTIKWLDPGRPSAAILANTEGGVIGKSGDHEIKLPDTGDPKHTNIVGKSGTGKSTLMINLVAHDIQAGRGVAVIDPHGRMIQDILRSCIPDDRIDDVVLIDIANTAYPPPLNPLSLPDEEGQIGVGQVMAILDKVYGFTSAPRALNVIETTLKTLRFEPQPTIRDAEELLVDTLKRQKLLQKHSRQLDPASRNFWRRFADMSPGSQDELTFPVTNRLQRFYSSEQLYAMTCHPDPINWGRLMAEKKIILVSLKANNAVVPASERQLLGVLVVSQLEIAARRFGESNRFNFRLYVDEAQKFVTTSLPEMFEEIRKCGVWLTIANQYLGQMTGKTLTAVMGNTTTTYAFEVSADDARELAPYVRPVFEVEDLVFLGKHRAIAKTSLNNVAQPAFRIDTLPPPPDHPEADAHVSRIVQRSIEQWTPKSRDDVLAWLRKRYLDEDIFTPQPDNEAGPEPNEDWEVSGDNQ